MSTVYIGYDGSMVDLGATADERMQARAQRNLPIISRWAKFFDVPIDWMMSFAENESSHNPRKINMTAREKGGAWGLFAQMADEAAWKISIVKKFYGKDPNVKKALAKWTGKPKSLLDPNLNTMLAAWQIGRLRKVFGEDLTTVAAAYHQGESAVKRRLEAGLPPVTKEKQPAGYLYASRIVEAQPEYLAMAY